MSVLKGFEVATKLTTYDPQHRGGEALAKRHHHINLVYARGAIFGSLALVELERSRDKEYECSRYVQNTRKSSTREICRENCLIYAGYARER